MLANNHAASELSEKGENDHHEMVGSIDCSTVQKTESESGNAGLGNHADFAEVTPGSDTTGKCLYGIDFNAIMPTPEKKPMFLSKRWRDSLCKCENCHELYRNKAIGYLLVKEDSMEEYERMAKQRRAENLEKQEGAALNFINGMNHVQKIEVFNGIADMKNELATFLVRFNKMHSFPSALGIFFLGSCLVHTCIMEMFLMQNSEISSNFPDK